MSELFRFGESNGGGESVEHITPWTWTIVWGRPREGEERVANGGEKGAPAIMSAF